MSTMCFNENCPLPKSGKQQACDGPCPLVDGVLADKLCGDIWATVSNYTPTNWTYMAKISDKMASLSRYEVSVSKKPPTLYIAVKK